MTTFKNELLLIFKRCMMKLKTYATVLEKMIHLELKIHRRVILYISKILILNKK
jgi:hypothetical protein